MQVIRAGDPESGGAERFSGSAEIVRYLMTGDVDLGVDISSVRFPAGAQTRWHSHSQGQILVVTKGFGHVTSRDGGRVDIGSGDVVVCPPDEWHWHGASAEAEMEHLSILPRFAGPNEALWNADGAVEG